MSNKQVIYAFRDPRLLCIRYIGYTKNMFRRVHYHYRDRNQGRKGQSALYMWLQELAELGILPVLEILEEIGPGVDWEEREQHWINLFTQRGEPLLNVTGGGLVGPWSREARNGRSQVIRKVWANYTPEQREQRRQIHRETYKGNQYRTNDGRLKRGADKARIQTGVAARRVWDEASPEYRAKVSEAHKQAHERMSPENRANILASLDAGRKHGDGNGRKWNEADRVAQSERTKGFWQSMTPEERKQYWNKTHGRT